MSIKKLVRKKNLKALQLNKGNLEAEHYAMRYTVFMPNDLNNDIVIAHLLDTFISSSLKNKDSNYCNKFREYLTETYKLNRNQIDDAEINGSNYSDPFTSSPTDYTYYNPEQIDMFRKRLTGHLNRAYKRVSAGCKILALSSGALTAGLGIGAFFSFKSIFTGVMFGPALTALTVGSGALTYKFIKTSRETAKSAKKTNRPMYRNGR